MPCAIFAARHGRLRCRRGARAVPRTHLAGGAPRRRGSGARRVRCSLPRGRNKMGMVGSVLRVCFGLTLAVFMLASWLVCRLLLLCSCISERTRGGCALVSTQLAFTATLFLSPWVWITAEPGKDEVWAEIQKQLDSDYRRPFCSGTTPRSWIRCSPSVSAAAPALATVRRRLHPPDLASTVHSKNACSRRLSVTHTWRITCSTCRSRACIKQWGTSRSHSRARRTATSVDKKRWRRHSFVWTTTFNPEAFCASFPRVS